MARYDDVAELIREGVSPHVISTRLDCDVNSVHSQIFRAVSKNLMTFIDVLRACGPLEEFLDTMYPSIREEPNFGSRSQYARLAVAEHYLQVREIECKLHESIKEALVDEYGADESQWWRNGISEQTRTDCVSRRERDPEGYVHEPFGYTMLIDLKKIADKRWGVLSERIPFLHRFQKKEFLDQMDKFNGFRNVTMHPIRIPVPSDEQMRQVQEFHSRICK